jgi:hypothetical protein
LEASGKRKPLRHKSQRLSAKPGFPLFIRHRRNLAGASVIAWMILQILIYLVTRNTDLMKIVFVVADDALVIVSVAMAGVLAFARGTAGRRPKSEAEPETDDENACSFRPQI